MLNIEVGSRSFGRVLREGWRWLGSVAALLAIAAMARGGTPFQQVAELGQLLAAPGLDEWGRQAEQWRVQTAEPIGTLCGIVALVAGIGLPRPADDGPVTPRSVSASTFWVALATAAGHPALFGPLLLGFGAGVVAGCSGEHRVGWREGSTRSLIRGLLDLASSALYLPLALAVLLTSGQRAPEAAGVE